jgi:alkylation response protein AidB-like acyl-CoA dehydrogenase
VTNVLLDHVVLSPAERDEVRRSIRDMVTAAYPNQARRDAAEGAALDRDAWRQLAAEYDLLGVHLPEQLGGQGQSFVYTALAAEAAGRQLAPTPFVRSGVLAAGLLAAGGTEAQRKQWLAPLLDGSLMVLPAGVEAGIGGPFGAAVEVRGTGDATVLNGTLPMVAHGAEADALVVVADAGPRAFVVDARAGGVGVELQETLDLTRPRAEIMLEDVPAQELTLLDGFALRRVLLEATVALALEQVAAARTCIETVVEYAMVRQQFGQPIGAFQAVQHQLADLFGEVETADASVEHAVDLCTLTPPGEAPDDLVLTARLAKAAASEAFVRIARAMIHLHGGIGFTWEHDAHLFYRRALTDRAFLGAPGEHRAALAASL